MKTIEMFVEFESKYNFTETIEKLSESILQNNWKVIIIHDLQEILRKNGKEVLPIKTIELCNPKYAFQILEHDHERNVSSLLPCRISIYEKSNRKTYISQMNVPVFAKQIGGLVETVMSQAYSDIEKIIELFKK